MEAVFGAPVSHEDDPERAVRAAYRMQPDRGGSNGGMTVHTGVETGPAVVADRHRLRGRRGGGRDRRLPRLGGHGRLGAGGPVTRAAVEAVFEWGPDEEAGPARFQADCGQLPGASQGQAWGPGRHLAWAAPLVGRGPELSVLDDALRGAVSGTGGVVFVVGEPGLGKTRLVSECRKRFMAWVGAGYGPAPAVA